MNIKAIKYNALALLCLVSGFNAYSQLYKKDQPFAHTYSIVARDSVTGEMAAAVQSHWFSVGSIVIWGKSGVGVVATQSFVNPAYGPQGLSLMEMGFSAPVSLQTLLAQDPAVDFRQVAFLDTNGEVAAHTGNSCVDYAHHIKGKNFSVQSNMMLGKKVPEAMAEAFTANSNLPLAERVLAALKAAENAGGDIRGAQSAALIVVSGNKNTPVWQDKLVDLRVEDHTSPVEELSRLLSVHRAYEHMNKGDLAVENSEMDKALFHYRSAMKMMPGNLEMKFWTAVALANNNEMETSLPLFKEVFSDKIMGKNWKEMLKRLPKVNLITVSEKDLTLILKQ